MAEHEHDDWMKDTRGRNLYRVADPIPALDPVMITWLGLKGITRGLQIRGVSTGERRAPLKGEWFLSGAIPAVYLAQNDLSMVYTICRLIVVKQNPITYTELTQ